jgi:hypothetical protein
MKGRISVNGKWKITRKQEPWGDCVWSKEHPSIYNAVLFYSNDPSNQYVGAALYPDFKPYPSKKLGDDHLINEAISECREELSSMLTDDIDYEMSHGYKNHGRSSEDNDDHADGDQNVSESKTHDDADHYVGVPWVDLSKNAAGQTMMNSQDIKRNPASREKGYNGELQTARVLNQICEQHDCSYTLNSIPLRNNLDLDHVLICRKGIFIIDSKMINKGYLVDGSSTWYWGETDRRGFYDWVEYDVQNDLLKNRDLIKQRLRDRGYGNVPDTQGLISPLIAMWDGQARLRSSASAKPAVEFVNANDNGLYHAIDSSIDHPSILEPDLVDALYSDMRRSTFWL